MNKFSPLLCFALVILTACNSNQENTDVPSLNEGEAVESKHQMRFEQLSAEASGISFTNSIVETEALNYFEFEYLYNGAGIAAGDINNDGLVDLYFTGNTVQDKLYLNKGDLKFEDITANAISEDLSLGWHAGVTMVDINADGWLDIYICRSDFVKGDERTNFENQLFINNQNNTFTESAADFGLASNRRSLQSAFFDFDNDGDLDLYLLNIPKLYKTATFEKNVFINNKLNGPDADQLFENQDGIYVDISKKAGIKSHMHGLGVATADVNNDGFTDVYVSNDFEDPDILYINNGDGTFTDQIKTSTNHISNYSMGNDIADVNNDGLLDIITLDMASEDHIRSKRNMGAMSTDYFWQIVDAGMHYQYMANAVQLNNGNGTFSDIGQLAGVSKTDWSWAPLNVDFDNDGFKDLFITNGFRADARDNDFNISYLKKKANGELGSLQEELAKIPVAKIQNYMYQNQGDLTYKKVTSDWGLDIGVNSNGAIYADLDNDGDLDIVTNNMEDLSSIFENQLESTNNYIRVKVEGYAGNSQAIGAKVKVFAGGVMQYQEVRVSRGYASCVEGVLHFGIGENKTIDKILVEWPDGTSKKVLEAGINSTVTLKKSGSNNMNLDSDKAATLFTDISDSLFQFKHKEVPFNDFESEILLPNKLSQSGPFITSGDVNGDGLEDFYISGAMGEVGELYVQNEQGFKLQKGPWQKEHKREEMDALFFDADQDGDADLYVVSGGNEYFYDSPYLIDQLYINDGKGNFTNESARLPQIPIGGQTVVAADYDKDGDLDLYVGGRQIPGYYPYVPKSYLFENNMGSFKDVTPNSPDLEGPGLVTDALFDDFDQDGDLDLIVVGEWMPVTFYENDKNTFSNVTQFYNPNQQVGWWYSIAKGEFNNDGRADYIVGNVGENNKFHPSDAYPLEIYCHDFDGNGTNDIVLGEYQDNICYPVRGRQCTSQQMPFVTEKFETFGEYATADLNKIYGEENLKKALHFSATNFSSVVFMSENEGYVVNNLPVYAQFGPINRAIILDVNKDGHQDVVAAGNNFGVEVETTRYDGGRGVVLLGNGKGQFTQLSPLESGFFDNNDVKDLQAIQFKGNTLIISVANQAKAKTFLLK